MSFVYDSPLPLWLKKERPEKTECFVRERLLYIINRRSDLKLFVQFLVFPYEMFLLLWLCSTTGLINIALITCSSPLHTPGSFVFPLILSFVLWPNCWGVAFLKQMFRFLFKVASREFQTPYELDSSSVVLVVYVYSSITFFFTSREFYHTFLLF